VHVKAKYEPSETLRDRSESKVDRDNGIRTAARRSREADAREEAKEAKRRRLTPDSAQGKGRDPSLACLSLWCTRPSHADSDANY